MPGRVFCMARRCAPPEISRGPAHDLKLFRAFEQAHFVEQKPDVAEFRPARPCRCAPACRTRLTQPITRASHCRHRRRRHSIRRLVRQQLGQHFVQLGDGVCLVEAERFPRSLRAVTEAIPDFALRYPSRGRRGCALCSLSRIRHDHQHCLGLGKAGQIIEIAVEAIGIMRVPVAHALRRGRNDGDTRSVHLGCQTSGAAR